MDTPKDALRRACKTCKGQTSLAQKLSVILGEKVTNKHIWNWLHLTKSIPPRIALPIEELTRAAVEASDGKLGERDRVYAHEIAPDCYPRADQQLRAAS